MEDVEEALADGLGQDVVLGAQDSGPDPAQRQEHRQRGAHAEEVLHLFSSRLQSRRHHAGPGTMKGGCFVNPAPFTGFL